MIYFECMIIDCVDCVDDYYYDCLVLIVDNLMIDDNYEYYIYNGIYNNVVDIYVVDVYNIGMVIILDQEVDLFIINNFYVVGIMLIQGYEWEDIDDNIVSIGVNSSEVFNNIIIVKDFIVIFGLWIDEGIIGWFGNIGNVSDYSGKFNFVIVDIDGDGVVDSIIVSWDDVVLVVVVYLNVDNVMQIIVDFSNFILMGDVIFFSNFDENFFLCGVDSYCDVDGEVDINGWDGIDCLDLILNNGSKWVGVV